MFTPASRACGYKTASGRAKWLSRDPIGEWGGINLYGFVDNAPVAFVDPSGLWLFGLFDPDPTWMDQKGNVHYNTPPSERPTPDPCSFGALHGFGDNDFNGLQADEVLTKISKDAADALAMTVAAVPLRIEEGIYVAVDAALAKQCSTDCRAVGKPSSV